MPWLLSVPRNAVSPVIESSDASWIGSPAAISTQPNSSAAQSTAPPVADVPPVAPVSPPPSSPHAAATSESAPRSANTVKYLRFFIQPPSEGVLRSWSYANANEELRFAPFLPFRRGGTYHIPQVAGHPARCRRFPPTVVIGVRNREHARTAGRQPNTCLGRRRRSERAGEPEGGSRVSVEQRSDERAPHHATVGERARLGGVRRLGDPDPHQERAGRERAEPPDELCGRLGQPVPRARDPVGRDAVDEPPRGVADRTQPVVRGPGRRQEDRGHRGSPARGDPVEGLV